jgi:CO/xanthine dehydrogenase Mo-binding subunit
MRLQCSPCLRIQIRQWSTRDRSKILEFAADVEVHFALSGGKEWGGISEPAGPPVPPAVANAIYFATGKRIRSTPFKNHDLSWS